jgi:predicted AlkP superfamily pyrophosphatase or phosphodiesterase
MMNSRRVVLGIIGASLACMTGFSADSAPTRPIAAVEHVVLISVDGLRPDVALRANMPTLREMMRTGSYTFWARTTEVSITLPSHTSMLTGVAPAKHGVDWNGDLVEQQRYPKVPTVLQLARQAGYVVSLMAGKSKFAALDAPGASDYSLVPDRETGIVDLATVTRRAEAVIAAHRPGFMFIHLPDVDSAGHHAGWGSRAQIAAAERTDAALARVRAALDHAGIGRSTIVILSADHGGAGLTHGPEDARSRHIPWVITGPGVRADFDLTRVPQLEVNTEDSAATVAYLLGLPLPAYLDGRPVLDAFLPATALGR